MTVLDPPRHQVVQTALDLSRQWCRGKTIDDAPALRHAVLVARTLLDHVPEAAVELIAAALLHDSLEFAPTFLDLDAHLDVRVAPGVARLVRALDAEHQRMDHGGPPELSEAGVTLVAAADKVIAFQSLLRRARRSDDPAEFWAKRAAVRRLLPYFHGWYILAAPTLPVSLARELRTSLSTLDAASNGRITSVGAKGEEWPITRTVPVPSK